MILCEGCPDNPACHNCLSELRSGDSAQKVIPPRLVRITNLSTLEEWQAQLIAVSRTAIGLFSREKPLHGRLEVQLADDFRIIGSGLHGISGVPYYVVDIEKVLRREEVLERLLLEEFHNWHMSGELDPSDLLGELKGKDEQRERLIRQELQKLSILRRIGTIFLYLYDEGKLRPLGTARAERDIEQEMYRFMQNDLLEGSLREQLVSKDGRKVFEMYASPLPDQTSGIALIDVTEAITEERRRQRREWEIYRDILGVVTHNKLLLLSDEELFFLLRNGRKSFSMDLRSPEHLADLRRACKHALKSLGLSDKRCLQFLVAVNEAASNTLKHGDGGMITVYVSAEERMCRAVIHDQGQGIVLEDLPRATLLHGYSTQKSLGAGFHVMLQFCDRVYLGSSLAGTKLILECVAPD